MCGMLFQACVPRLCHLGWIWDGKVKACIQGWQRWWHRAKGNHQRERSPGTPLRNWILRHGTPTATSLAQFDRDKSSRHIGAKLLQSQTGLFTLGPSNAKVEKANDRLLQPSAASKRHHNNDGGDDRGRKSSKVRHRYVEEAMTVCRPSSGTWRRR